MPASVNKEGGTAAHETHHQPSKGIIIDTYVEMEGETLDAAKVISDHSATLGQLFTVMRQWEPSTQSKIEDLVSEFLARGGTVHDRDALTGDTLLHFACKAGARGMGTTREAVGAVEALLNEGASPNAQSRWSGLTPVHIAAMFGFAEGLELLLGGRRPAKLNARASHFDNMTPLHLAVQCGHDDCVDVLLRGGACKTTRDDNGRIALDYLSSDTHPNAPKAGLASIRSMLTGYASSKTSLGSTSPASSPKKKSMRTSKTGSNGAKKVTSSRKASTPAQPGKKSSGIPVSSSSPRKKTAFNAGSATTTLKSLPPPTSTPRIMEVSPPHSQETKRMYLKSFEDV